MKVRAALALLPKRDPELFFIEAYISRGDISFLFCLQSVTVTGKLVKIDSRRHGSTFYRFTFLFR